MNELIQQIVSQLGLSEDQAQGTVGMVVTFLKSKLPENLHGMLDQVMSGEEIDQAGLADMAKGAIGNIFGGKK